MRFLTVSLLASVMSFTGVAAHAAETRGFAVNWFYPAMYSTKDDCVDGNNPSAEKLFVRILKEMNTPPEEIEKLMTDFPFTFSSKYGNRGMVDGKPVNAYLNPTSVPDPNIKTSIGTMGYGFNLDGKIGPNDFTDPDTAEKGVDNLAARAMGCFATLRGGPKERQVHLSSRWEETRGHMQAWLIEISGIDDYANDEAITLKFFRAKEAVYRDNNTDSLADMTFRVDHNERSTNVLKGRIKDGMVLTDAQDVRMIGDPFHMPNVIFDQARMRLAFQPNGDLKGIVGGYMPFTDIYMSLALTGTLSESMLSVDLPGFYYALRKLADANPDPKTGMNMNISTSFVIEAVPAFITDGEGSQVSQVGN
jgi:hypothetical protein